MENKIIESTLKELLSVVKIINERVGTLEEGQQSLASSQQALAESQQALTESQQALTESHQALTESHQALADSQREGFRKVNEQLERMELKLEATFEQTARITEEVSSVIVDRLDAHRNMIAKVEEEVEILKSRHKS
ncbi:hypothetical protein SAMN04487969_12250 [Paenibacillus algorifonticola]|uniref:Uncharacterized protein n=1 Tax=Paenibacillus algorifonticola TaxID=684063 RepID=A0A1I2HHB0_9BACL|nr:hypothetical protein [Paenibacillus algorifonticola]SFF27861.1 hypothetical protein SAMN04487969_12250 [Paenibacillus algorifonticola]